MAFSMRKAKNAYLAVILILALAAAAVIGTAGITVSASDGGQAHAHGSDSAAMTKDQRGTQYGTMEEVNTKVITAMATSERNRA